MGRCPVCGEWDTFVEERHDSRERPSREAVRSVHPLPLSAVGAQPLERLQTGIGELDRVTGGGFVPGSLVLLAGDPGVGKSTLLLQACAQLRGASALYISGEESLEQLRLRAERLSCAPDQLWVFAETELDAIEEALAQSQANFVVIDSIHTLYSPTVDSPPGSVAQVREAAARLLQVAKSTGKVIVVVGHVTKEGLIAGPKVLEHIVDTVLHFEGETPYAYRVLRAIKNRFGPTHELGFFEMTAAGLRELPNPSALFMTHEARAESGVALAAVLEGTRPLLVEVQALVTPSTYAVPQRSITGYDYRRLHMIMAVLERRLGIALRQHDLFANIVGGLRLDDPALDLAVALAIVSAYRDQPLPPQTAVFGEIGLTGELRPVRLPEIRLREAQRLGIRRLLLPKANAETLSSTAIEVELLPVERLSLALSAIL